MKASTRSFARSRRTKTATTRVRMLAFLLYGCMLPVMAQEAAQAPDLSQQVQQLSDALTRAQSQLEQSQRELEELRNQLSAMKLQLAAQGIALPSQSGPPVQPPSTPSSSSSEDLRERLAITESQIATQEQSKVESDSKYPVKITGMLLFNGFVNTSAVNLPATPTLALGGSGSTGGSIRQTILGFDARGPHLFGGQSSADLRIDFAGVTQSNTENGSFAGPYSSSAAFLRLRTAHASLNWEHTQLAFALDRPLISPDTPTSLTAVAEPALAWSGNLWTWNPQLEVTHDFDLPGRSRFRAQAALIDVADSPFTPQLTATTAASSEQSRLPGAEARIAFLRPHSDESDTHLGVGGYFAPHRLGPGITYESWAASLDANLHLGPHLIWTANVYRGRALGGLGGGDYKDIAYYTNPAGETYIYPLDNVGGWTQLKERISNRLEFNEAFGTDQIFSHQLRRYAGVGASYQNLAAARTWTSNVLYRPSAYLLFSVEYRRLLDAWAVGSPVAANVIGLAAGYKF
jgi:uncharacterized coiled-coil protein SlyX